MSTRKEIVSGFYSRADEDTRLKRSRHGQLEYATTMAYIHRYAGSGSRVLEVGAGTGRYSIALAKEGMNVTAVELVESNLAVLKENSKGIACIEACQGDATDLSRFADDSFDLTLLLGPMYHLYEPEEVNRAIDEAVRVVTIPGVDACACCAPHVRRTGEIGVIRILKSLRYKGGTRLTILSGRRALALMQQQLIVLEDVSHLTSRKQEELAEGVRSLLEENAAQRFRIGELERQITDLRLSAIPAERKNVFLAEADMSPLAQRGYVNGLCERHEGCCGVFVGNDSEGYKFIIGARQSDAKHQNALHSDARQAAALLRETLGARGGGKPAMVQGSVKATWQEIQKALEGLS